MLIHRTKDSLHELVEARVFLVTWVIQAQPADMFESCIKQNMLRICLRSVRGQFSVMSAADTASFVRCTSNI